MQNNARFLRNFQAEVVIGATAAALATALNAFFEAAGEKVYVDMQFSFDGATYTVLVVYAI